MVNGIEVFSHATAMSVNMVFNKEDSILIKILYQLLNGQTVLQLLKEFPSKSWNERSLSRLLKTYTHRFSLQNLC